MTFPPLPSRTPVQAACGLALLLASTATLAQITFFESEDYRGRTFAASSWVNNFNRYGFNDRASSAIVETGRWEVCEDIRFQGHCAVLPPGNYDSLRAMGLNDRISSVRPVSTGASSTRPPIDSEAGQEYRRRPNERLREVPVSSARAVVGPPEERCWMERAAVQNTPRDPNVGGAIAGALIGGILGHQIGGGVGKDIATAGGVVAGGVLGSRMGRNDNAPPAQEVRRCETMANTTPAYWDVTYVFRGQPHHVQMRNDPGRTIAVNNLGEPRE